MGARCERTTCVDTRLVGPRLEGPDDAVAVLRLSARSDAREAIVVLVCDEDRRVLLALEVTATPVQGVARVAGCVVAALPEAMSASLVVGLFRGAGSTFLDGGELAAVEDLGSRCETVGLTLLDVIVVSGHRWRSLAEVAGAGFGGDNGDQ